MDMTRRRIEQDAPEETTEAIHIKYRPRKLEDVIGQKPVVKSLGAALRAKARPHVFLFTGPAGTGKTTLARIVMADSGVDPANLTEVDAASNTGIDDARALLAPLRYQGFGDSPNKGIIIDEAHRLSKNAWDAFLKSTEEPPAHVFFCFCTSEPDKVPAAMVRRCLSYSLGAVGFDDLMDLMEDVCDREGYDPDPKIIARAAVAANGSPGLALQLLAAVHDCRDEEEAAVLLAQPLDNKEVIDLCRQMVKGDLEWSRLCATLKALGDVPPESIRIIIINYLNACALGARNDRDAMRLLDMLECFGKPCNPSDKLAPILTAFGRFIFG